MLVNQALIKPKVSAVSLRKIASHNREAESSTSVLAKQTETETALVTGILLRWRFFTIDILLKNGSFRERPHQLRRPLSPLA